MQNSYVDIQTLKDIGVLNITTSGYDARLRSLAESVSRQIDKWANRRFYYVIETKKFDGNGHTELFVPDLISISSITEDNNLDGTFNITWGTNDYILYPRQSSPTSSDGNARPYTTIQVSQKINGTQDAFVSGQDNYQIAGTWGYSKVTLDSGLNGTLSDGTSTNIVFDGSSTGNVEIGHTLVIEDEQCYVTNTTGTSATVIRSVNGSTGTAHTNKDVYIVQFPGPVVDAVIIQTSRLWRRKDSAFANSVGFPESGQIVTFRSGLDPDAKTLISPYRKLVV